MKPKYVVWECEECGRLFYREVAQTLIDDTDDVHVKVALLDEYGSKELEEFPMCVCLGGDVLHVVMPSEAETSESAN